MVGFTSQSPPPVIQPVPACSRRVWPNNPRGFTLIELILVAAVIGILALMSGPLFVSFLKSQQLKGAAEQVRTLLNQARQLAIAGNTSYTVVVETANKRLRFCTDGATCAAANVWKGPGTDGDGYIKLDDAIDVVSTSTNSTFNYLGAATAAGTIKVKKESACMDVIVSASGRIRTASSATCP